MNIKERDFYENTEVIHTKHPCNTCIWMKVDEYEEPCIYCIHMSNEKKEIPEEFNYECLKKETFDYE